MSNEAVSAASASLEPVDAIRVENLGKSFGEATPEEKHAVSHRGRAFAAFKTGVLA